MCHYTAAARLSHNSANNTSFANLFAVSAGAQFPEGDGGGSGDVE